MPKKSVKPPQAGAREAFDPETLSGIGFFDVASHRQMRYIYPDAGHWAAGWIVVRNPSGAWMTLRKATEADIAALNSAVSSTHHEPDTDLSFLPEKGAVALRPKASFDAKCLELAEYFMREPPGKWRGEDMNELAELIQRTIEDFMHEDEEDVL